MPHYATEGPATSQRTPVPTDLPDPAKEIARGIRPGSIIVSDEVRESDGKPRQFRLQAERRIPALWREIVPRQVTATVPDEDEEEDEDDEPEEDEEDEEDTPPPPPVVKKRTRRTA